VLDDVRIAVRRLEKGHDRQVFDDVALNMSLLPTPNKALRAHLPGSPPTSPLLGTTMIRLPPIPLLFLGLLPWVLGPSLSHPTPLPTLP
jgi:hypothetical protein